jgi:hypothetical protein
MQRRAVLSTLLATLPTVCVAQDNFTLGGVVLLQPEQDLAPRVRSVEELAGYIRGVEKAAKKYFSRVTTGPRSGFIIVAVKPVQQSNVWFDFSPKLPVPVSSELSLRLRKVFPMRVTQGPVVFALRVGLAGADPPSKPMPEPEEWKAEANKAGRPVETGELVLRLWRE